MNQKAEGAAARREHGLLLADQLALAAIEGRKLQTRRLLTPQTVTIDGPTCPREAFEALDWTTGTVDAGPSPAGNPGPYLHVRWRDEDRGHSARVYPRVQPGDLLWLREAWAWVRDAGGVETPRYRPAPQPGPNGERGITWRANWRGNPSGLRWRPNIHMPRWASRWSGTAAAVRIERLRDITEADAVAEGAERAGATGTRYLNPRRNEPDATYTVHNARQWFRLLWGTLSTGGASWDANPWVLVYDWAPPTPAGGGRR